MSRESSLGGQIPNLEPLNDVVVYQPTPEDRRLKIEFLRCIDGNPLIEAKELPIDHAERILGKRLPNKEKAGFSAWFLNRDEQAQKLEYLFALALQAAEDVLCNTDPKAQSARVNMVKAIAELAGKIPGRGPNTAGQTPTNLLQSIQTMDKFQLQAFLKKNGDTLSITASKGDDSADPITVEPIKE